MTNSILVVDDEQVLAGAMADYLGRYGYMVTVKSSWEDALRVIDVEPPDIVVLDYRLPRMGDWRFCAESKSPVQKLKSSCSPRTARWRAPLKR